LRIGIQALLRFERAGRFGREIVNAPCFAFVASHRLSSTGIGEVAPALATAATIDDLRDHAQGAWSAPANKRKGLSRIDGTT